MAGNEAIMEKSVRRRRVRPQQDAEQHIKLKMTRLVSQSILSAHTKVSSYILQVVLVSVVHTLLIIMLNYTVQIQNSSLLPMHISFTQGYFVLAFTF